MKIKFYDTKEKKKIFFKPIDPTNIRFYVCGPTVYERAHIGNARPAVVFDILFRFLRQVFGPESVTYVRNFTDIDDKINTQSLKSGRSIKNITDETIRWYEEDMRQLNILTPSQSPRATEYIGAMINQIKILLANKNAYLDGSGHVLFSVKSFPDYGSLSQRKLNEMEIGSRIAVANNKRDPLDFVLWKPSEPEVPGWESPWGRGRPGWHIECSAMIKELIGNNFDIHGGGIDLVFPHHENELAQSCCAYPSSRFANIWMHNGFLQVEGEKMSKSLGNFFTVHDLTASGLNGEIIRMVLMSTHYRQPLDWTSKRVEDASKTLKKWRVSCVGVPPADEPSALVLSALADDLNTPKAFAELHALASSGDFSGLLTSARFLGLLNDDPNMVIQSKKLNALDQAKIEVLLQERMEAKKLKNFVKADLIRKNLEEIGVSIKDTAEKTDWNLSSNFDEKKLKELE